MAGYVAKPAEPGRTLPCADSLSVPCAHALVRERERERDVYPGLVSFLAVAFCPQWLRSQTASVSFVFPT